MSARVWPRVWAPIPYFAGENLLVIDELRVALLRAGIDEAVEPVLIRASELAKLERVLAHGTDRAGYPGDRRWRYDPAIAHADVILATTLRQNREGEAASTISTSIKKLPLIPAPMVIVYAKAAFEHLRDNHWRFRDPTRKSEAVRAIVPINRLELPEGWFRRDEGLGYRQWVDRTLPARAGRIVEVGCWLGRSTAYVARLCAARAAELVCVDTWAGSSDRFDSRYRELLATRDVEGEFRALLAALGAAATILRESSLAAAERFAPGSVDLVFLDASHDRAAVAADIAAWAPRVRPGGVLGGHDFASERHRGVVEAVEAAARERGLEPTRGPGSTWWLTL